MVFYMNSIHITDTNLSFHTIAANMLNKYQISEVQKFIIKSEMPKRKSRKKLEKYLKKLSLEKTRYKIEEFVND